MKRFIYMLIGVALGISAIILIRQSSSSNPLTLKPDHLKMLVSLDGEEDEYYEELTLKYKGKTVKARDVTWVSKDPSIAEVDEDGWVTSRGVGSTTIIATYKGKSVRCTVDVIQKITSDTC